MIMKKKKKQLLFIYLFLFWSLLDHFTFISPLIQDHQEHHHQYEESKNFEGSSDLVNLQYHMGPVLTSPINLYIIWYGQWNPNHQNTIRDFLYSLSPSSSVPHRPSVADWWRVNLRLYTDQTGSNITGEITLSGEFFDWKYSQGKYLTRLSMQSLIKSAHDTTSFPLNYSNGVYLILTSPDVEVQDFCRAVCGFHYFTFPSIVGVTVPYAWIGHSGKQCPGMCAYPFALMAPPSGSAAITATTTAADPDRLMKAPNGDVGVDGMISVIGHELAEVSSNPLVNAWYGGDDPSAPNEIADLCMGIYGTGGGGGFAGIVYKDSFGNGFNVYGVKGRKFLVQWVWNPVRNRCFGPNAID